MRDTAITVKELEAMVGRTPGRQLAPAVVRVCPVIYGSISFPLDQDGGIDLPPDTAIHPEAYRSLFRREKRQRSFTKSGENLTL
jgi:hypothetical protein